MAERLHLEALDLEHLISRAAVIPHMKVLPWFLA